MQGFITATHAKSLDASRLFMSLWSCMIILLILHCSSGSWENMFLFLCCLFFFFAFCCEDHSLLWEQLIFSILIVSDGETNILGNFIKKVTRKDNYLVEQEHNPSEYSCSNCCTYLNCPSDTVQIFAFKCMQLIKW